MNTLPLGVTVTAYHPHASRSTVVATATGFAYLVLGCIGFYAGRATEFRNGSGTTILGIIQVNPFQSLVHCGIAGSLLFAAWVGRSLARVVNTLIGLFCVCLGSIGVFLANTSWNLFAFNGTANVVHIVTAIVLLSSVASTRHSFVVRRHALW